MRTLKTSEAAALLNVSPNTLRTWERRFGYPHPRRSAGRHRRYVWGEISALREALDAGMSISSAVAAAADPFADAQHTLAAALAEFRTDRADWAMEASLSLRSLERTLEELLLPAMEDVRRRKGVDSAAWAFASQWATGWVCRAQGVTPRGDSHGILIGDASDGTSDPDCLYIRVLDLLCRRSGAIVLTLPVHALRRLDEPVRAIGPALVVIAGDHACDDDVARWAYGVRRAAGDVPFCVFHRTYSGNGLNGSAPRALPNSPATSTQALLARIGNGHHPAA
jgi:MerR family transcriptional regulator, light-induced transcriptional regulator